MLFYFVRHGQTKPNRQHLLAGGGMDVELTEEGHQQAQALAKEIKRHIPHPVHRLLVSDLIRTRQTAHYLAGELALPMEIQPGLREWSLGEWEGCAFADYKHLLLGDGEPKLGESRLDFYNRIKKTWQQIHSDHKPYLIVSHGAVWMALQDHLEIPRFKISNCQLIRVEKQNGVWRATCATQTPV